MHEGHRKRMLDRIRKNGLDSLQEHEVLEVLLFYTIPRKNTNETAHLLLEKFGTLANVLDAEEVELLKVNGIGPRTATLIKMIPEFLRVYQKSHMLEFPLFDSVSIAQDFGKALFCGETNEKVYAVLLDNKLTKIDCIQLSSGSIGSVSFDLRELYRDCINKHVSAVILYHNHPNGLSVPSRRDLEVTTQVELKLADIGVILLEHFIVGATSCLPLIKNIKSFSRTYVPNNDITETAIEYFYDK